MNQPMLKSWVKEKLRDAYWEFCGRGLKNPAFATCPTTFLFVCKGNICRSPFAQGYAMKVAKSMQLSECMFLSAGLEVSTVVPPPSEAVVAAKSFGVDIEEHRSTRVTENILTVSDMVIAMEAQHFHSLRDAFPRFKDKLFLLPLFDRGTGRMRRGFSSFNIADPYGKSSAQFHVCFKAIARYIDVLFSDITLKKTARS